MHTQNLGIVDQYALFPFEKFDQKSPMLSAEKTSGATLECSTPRILIAMEIQGSYRQVSVKFKDFSTTSKDYPAVFKD